jgi:hypothetical protein
MATVSEAFRCIRFWERASAMGVREGSPER